MSIEGVVFDNQPVSGSDHGIIFQNMLEDGVLSGCELSFSGSKIYIDPGYFIAAGRVSELTDKETVTVSTVNQYVRLIANVDLTKESSDDKFEQFYFSYDATSDVSNFSTLTRGSINDGSDQLFQVEVAIFEVENGAIKSIKRQIGPTRVKVIELTVTISASSWDGNQATVSCPAVHYNNHPFVTFAPSSFLTWRDCGIFCAGFDEGSISFACITKPTIDVSAIVRL